ncbi:hypothetical protein SSS_07039 [Sarcoptes scabiei]|uniref:Uncharacterized protein n=1 Tax=Sarcoptes scabiei TaxID=52283 RepID=A0A834RAM1_SARSC|nr:hypothetical protein SSS_07039 [Sarcoptes scabiei]UXI19932.1 mediator of RNA polymerase II transcription subunit 18 [Sarcoptes scabiei]
MSFNFHRSSHSPTADGYWIRSKTSKQTVRIYFPPFFLFSNILLATFGPWFTFVTINLILPLTFLALHLFCLKGQAKHSSFYVSWSFFSFVLLISVFEAIVVPFLEITIWENYSLLLLVTIGILLIIYVRHRSLAITNDVCYVDDHRSNIYREQRFLFYSVCLSAPIFGNQLKFYLVILLSIISSLIYGIYLNVTTICHTQIKFDFLLVPDDCSEVYLNFNLSLSFACALYSLILVIPLLNSLLKNLSRLYRIIVRDHRDNNHHLRDDY